MNFEFSSAFQYSFLERAWFLYVPDGASNVQVNGAAMVDGLLYREAPGLPEPPLAKPAAAAFLRALSASVRDRGPSSSAGGATADSRRFDPSSTGGLAAPCTFAVRAGPVSRARRSLTRRPNSVNPSSTDSGASA